MTYTSELNKFINAHYTFKREKKYLGLFGKIKAIWDKLIIEQEEENNTNERYEYPGQIYFSSPQPDEFIKKLKIEQEEFRKQNSFSTALLKLINRKNKDNVTVYKSAGIDRKLFSKIISDYNYIPSKKTIIALSIGIELTLPETQDLLKHAGFILSENILSDVIVTFFIQNANYDINLINSTLIAYSQKPLT